MTTPAPAPYRRSTHVCLERRGNNPNGHHRAHECEKSGLRKRLVQVERAPGGPFAYGRFALLTEAP